VSISAVIEVVIGLSFLYAVLSVIASSVNELVSSAFALRAKTLEKGVANLLANPEEAAAIYAHPVIRSLFRSNRRPSYIPSETFALALLDTKVKPAVGVVTDQVAAITSTIHDLPAGRVKDTLDILWRDAKHDADKLRKGVEAWFDDTMERVSGWYRRLIQVILLGIGLTIAVTLNINTLTVAQRLWTDGPLRAAVVQQAARETPPDAAGTEASGTQGVGKRLDSVERSLRTVDGLSLPIGWSTQAQPSSWWVAGAGWALTALAISFGAPFWFDVLGQVARLRSSGVRPDPSVPRGADSESPK